MLKQKSFRRVKIRSDFEKIYNAFEKYTIVEDTRDQVANELYKDSTLDWVVLISANILNVRNECLYQIVILKHMHMIYMVIL